MIEIQINTLLFTVQVVERVTLQYLSNMLSDSTLLKKEYAKRNKDTFVEEFPADVVDLNQLHQKYGPQNVKLIKSRKTYKCTSEKDVGRKFEDRIWSILYRMGFDELNSNNCKLYCNEDGTITKQIDVVAKFESVVFIIECKSTSKNKRPLKNEINEFSSIKQNGDQFVKKQYNEGGSKRMNVAWILATDSEQLVDGTEEYAKNCNIRLVSNWDYYDKLSSVLGPAAKYQLLANIFQQREIKDLSPIVFAIRGQIGKFRYYQFSINPHDLMRISFVPHHSNGDSNLSFYQRLVKPGRLKIISDYIQTEGGIFPTNIVINLTNKNKELQFDKIQNSSNGTSIGRLHLPNYFGSAEIIDGQHRLFSYANIAESETELIPVFAFENLDYDMQSELFVKINGEQEKVKTDLLNSIVGYQNWNSENESKQFYAIPLMLANELNDNEKSIFFHKIKQDGGKSSDNASMTYREISEKLKRLRLFGTLTKNKRIDADLLYYNNPKESLTNGFKFVDSFFRYIIDNSYRFGEEWNSGGFFAKNNSVIPLLVIMKHILVDISKTQPVKDHKMSTYINLVYNYVDPICQYFNNMSDDEYAEYRSGAGEKGYNMRVDKLILVINESIPGFMTQESEEIRNRLESKQESNASTSDSEALRELEIRLQFVIKTTLERTAGKFWFNYNVPNDVKSSAIANAVAHNELNDYIRGCFLIDMKKIAEYKQNGDELQILNLFNEQKKASRFSWIAKLNEIRNSVFHSWNISDDDKKFLEDVKSIFEPRFDEYIEKYDLEKQWTKYHDYTPPKNEEES